MKGPFTQGPWAYSTSDEGWTFSIYQADDAGFTPESSDVATLFAHTVQCDPKDIQEANARLIAAAPDLLKACKAVANSGMRNAAYDACVAAIAAATGETK